MGEYEDTAVGGDGDEGARCALPGCGQPVEAAPGRPQRLYCSAAHRMAMRRLRRTAAHSAADPRVAEMLPWLREPVGHQRAARVARNLRSAPGSDHPPSDHPPSDPPGPDHPVSDRPGRGRSGPGPADRDPRPVAVPSGWARALVRRKRAVAVLGASAVLIGGYVLSVAVPAVHSPPAVTAGPTTDEQWAGRVEIALTAVSDQLDTIAQAETEWQRSEQGRQGGTPPAAVRRMQQRKQVLEQQRVTLTAQLQSYRELERSADELRKADAQLAAIEKLLADPPAGEQPDPAWAAALREQRDLRAKHRDAIQAQVATLRDGVDAATRGPLPDEKAEAARTEQVAAEVQALGTGEQPPPAPASTTRPPLAHGREEEERNPGAVVGTSGPPDPRGPVDETVEKDRRSGEPAASGSPGKGAGGAAQDTGKAAGGAVRDTGKAAGGAVGAVGEGAGGAVEKTGEGVGGAVEEVGKGAGEALGGGSGPGTAGGAGAKSGPGAKSGAGAESGAGAKGGTGSGGSGKAARSAGASGAPEEGSAPAGSGSGGSAATGGAQAPAPAARPAPQIPAQAPAPVPNPATGMATAMTPFAQVASGGVAAPFVAAGLREADRRLAEPESGPAGSGSTGSGSGTGSGGASVWP